MEPSSCGICLNKIIFYGAKLSCGICGFGICVKCHKYGKSINLFSEIVFPSYLYMCSSRCHELSINYILSQCNERDPDRSLETKFRIFVYDIHESPYYLTYRKMQETREFWIQSPRIKKILHNFINIDDINAIICEF